MGTPNAKQISIGYEPFPVRIIKYMIILAAMAASPFYIFWIACGAAADKIGQRRHQ